MAVPDTVCRAGGELNRDGPVRVDLGHDANLTVGVAKLLGFQVVGGGHHSVAHVEPMTAVARVELRL